MSASHSVPIYDIKNRKSVNSINSDELDYGVV